MDTQNFLTVISVMAKEIEMLRYQLETANKELERLNNKKEEKPTWL